jgi:hypothetical protein
MLLTLMLTTAALLAPEAVVNADVLLIEEVRQAENMPLPVNGMNQEEVRARFGVPAQVHPPVGEPPITRWDYDQWSVYFEYDLVLFSVLKKGHVLDKNRD